MFRITNLVKVTGTDPQQFMLVLKDLDNKMKGYVQDTRHGTESQIRGELKRGGVPFGSDSKTGLVNFVPDLRLLTVLAHFLLTS